MTASAATPLLTYCTRCRAKREVRDAKPEFTKSGVPATRGQCSTCGGNVYRMGATAAHATLPKPARAPKPARRRSQAKTTRKARGRKPRAGKAGKASRSSLGRLVIVESPAKARSIGGYLGDGYTVLSSKGHVRDLLKSRLSVDIEHNFEPEYRVPNDKRTVVKELRAAAADAEEIYLATDPDREGEAIAWHLIAAAEMPPRQTRRVVFQEITGSAIREAFRQPRSIDLDLVNAQQARRILDRLVGYQVSQLLWSKVRSGLSAGRVQSIALRLVVEREKEIEVFQPVEYWTVHADLARQAPSAAPTAFRAQLLRIGEQRVTYDAKSSQPPLLASAAALQPHIETLKRSRFRVTNVKRGTRQSKAAPPFTTSTLQQAAANSTGFRARQIMSLAQQLYEGIDIGQGSPVGLITYMRTDSLQVSQGAQADARRFVTKNLGEKYLPKQPPQYKTRAKGAQEAHEAIRPTSVARSPEAMRKFLTSEQWRLYALIWQRFLASQMAAAIYSTLRIDIEAGLQAEDMPYKWRASGSQLVFAGHLAAVRMAGAVGSSAAASKSHNLPDLQAGEWLDAKQILPEQHFTQPPPRYSEASLIRKLEELGIGRPSTYAPTVSVIQTRDYVQHKDRRLHPSRTGTVVSELLKEFFPDEMDYAFTAKLESQLDEVSQGKLDWRPMLGEFYAPFAQRLEHARDNMPRREVIEKVGRSCPDCSDGELLVKYSRFGKFIGCSNYPDCRHTERYLERVGLACPACGDEHGGEIVARRSRKGRTFYGCIRYPDCDFTVWKLPKKAATRKEAIDSEAKPAP